MRGSEEKRFRKRMLALLLCAVVTCQSFLPAANNFVFAAEVPDITAGAAVQPEEQAPAETVAETAPVQPEEADLSAEPAAEAAPAPEAESAAQASDGGGGRACGRCGS